MSAPFDRVLGELIRAVPGAKYAILFDDEGEVIDSFPALMPSSIDVQLIGAYLGLVSTALESGSVLHARFSNAGWAFARRSEDLRLGLGLSPQARLNVSATQAILSYLDSLEGLLK